MIGKLRKRFVCFAMAIATILLSLLFIALGYFMSYSVEYENYTAMNVVLDNPEEILSRSDNSESYLYSAFFVDPVGTITKSYGHTYSRSQLEQIYHAIHNRILSGTDDYRLDQYQIYYSYYETSSGTWFILCDSTDNLEYLRYLRKTLIFLYILSIVVIFILIMIIARFFTKPTERAWNQQKQFISNASHELKTPLTVILTNAELMQKKDITEAEQKKYSMNILTESHQMKSLIQNLLDLARVDRGIPKENFSPIDFSKLAEDESLVMEVELFERSHLLTTEITPNLRVKGDTSKLRQVIDIILDNAGKYADESTEIKMVLKKDGSHAIFSVENEGSDIKAEDLQKIFQRFYRIDEARSLNGSYGLGLSIAQEIVSQHRGSIWAESSNHKVTFKVKLPLC